MLIKFGDINLALHNIDSVSVYDSATCDLEDCVPSNFVSNKFLKVLNQNIRSIFKNINGFHTVLTRSRIHWDIITLTECWLRNNDSVPDLDGYNSFKTSANITQNEGVVVYVHKGYNVSVDEPAFLDANCLQIQIDRDTILLAIYRPPGYKDITNFLNSLNLILMRISQFNNIIISGDINININDNYQDSNKNNYLNLLASFGLLPAHSLPTRLNSCLDHIILKTVLPAKTYVAHSALTDHETVLLYLAKKMPQLNSHKTIVRFNREQLDLDIRRLDFSQIYSIQDPHYAAELMIKLITQAIDSNTKILKVPNRKKSIKTVDYTRPSALYTTQR